MKIAGLPPAYYRVADTDDFMAQAQEFDDYDASAGDKAAKALSILQATHPWTVLRAKELIEWVDSGRYDGLIAEHTVGYGVTPLRETVRACSGDGTPSDAGQVDRFCKDCGVEFGGSERFCTACGTPRE